MTRKYQENSFIGPKHLFFLRYTTRGNHYHWKGIFLCPYCNNEFETYITSVQQGKINGCGCLQCKLKYHKGDFVGPNQLLLVSNCWREKKKTFGMFECPYCGKIFKARVDTVTCGQIVSCKCQRKVRGMIQGARSFIDLSGKKFGKLLAVQPFILNGYKSKYQCVCECGRIVEVYTQNLKRGFTKSCGCIKSRGEEKVASCLNELDIKFEKQKTFLNCKNTTTGYNLYFDFYLPDYNICIEYDGSQHYVGWYNDKRSLMENQYRDSIKNQYCENNGIYLIRIPYWDYSDIDADYIKDKLEKLFVREELY